MENLLRQARDSSSKGQAPNSGYYIHGALSYGPGPAAVRTLFASSPELRNQYVDYLVKNIDDATTAGNLRNSREMVLLAQQSATLPSETINLMLQRIQRAAADGNTSGRVAFLLDDSLDGFEALRAPGHQQLIVARSVKHLQDPQVHRGPLSPLMDYAIAVGPTTTEGLRILALLPSLNIRRQELALVARAYPDYARSRESELTLRASFILKNGDRILADDMLTVLKQDIRGVQWLPQDSAAPVGVVVERVRSDERVLPERTQTVSYAQHQVDTMSAVLLMPKNATYHFELIQGGAEIEYGYVVQAFVNGKQVHDQLVRGRVGGEASRCQNARVQNVFGGTSPASFVANDDMRSKCGRSSSADIDSLRREVYVKLKDAILTIPSIKTVHDANQPQ